MAVLIYTRNHTLSGKGFVHDDSAVCAAALTELCAKEGLAAEASDDPSVFTPEALAAFANGRYPLAWCRRHGDGRVFYTGLGHKKEHYQDAAFRAHLAKGLFWAMGK